MFKSLNIDMPICDFCGIRLYWSYASVGWTHYGYDQRSCPLITYPPGTPYEAKSVGRPSGNVFI